jgi:hypothetical protein
MAKCINRIKGFDVETNGGNVLKFNLVQHNFGLLSNGGGVFRGF